MVRGIHILWAVTVVGTLFGPCSASAQVMYKCTFPNGNIAYGFQSRSSVDCSAITMSDAYRDGIVLKELSLVCSGTHELSGSAFSTLVERRTETFHLVNGRWNNGPCDWSAKHIHCGNSDDVRFGIAGGDYTLVIDRYSGSASSRMLSPGSIGEFKGTCEIKTKPKF
jgi:hypothetical protein